MTRYLVLIAFKVTIPHVLDVTRLRKKKGVRKGQFLNESHTSLIQHRLPLHKDE